MSMCKIRLVVYRSLCMLYVHGRLCIALVYSIDFFWQGMLMNKQLSGRGIDRKAWTDQVRGTVMSCTARTASMTDRVCF